MSVRYSPEARADLREALDYLTARSLLAAARLQSGVERLLGQLDAREFDGPEDRLKSGEVVRSWPFSPWRVYYQRQPDGVLWVVRIYHQARRPITRRWRRRQR